MAQVSLNSYHVAPSLDWGRPLSVSRSDKDAGREKAEMLQWQGGLSLNEIDRPIQNHIEEVKI